MFYTSNLEVYLGETTTVNYFNSSRAVDLELLEHSLESCLKLITDYWFISLSFVETLAEFTTIDTIRENRRELTLGLTTPALRPPSISMLECIENITLFNYIYNNKSTILLFSLVQHHEIDNKTLNISENEWLNDPDDIIGTILNATFQ